MTLEIEVPRAKIKLGNPPHIEEYLGPIREPTIRRRDRRPRLWGNAHRLQVPHPKREDVSVGTVVVAHQITRS